MLIYIIHICITVYILYVKNTLYFVNREKRDFSSIIFLNFINPYIYKDMYCLYYS